MTTPPSKPCWAIFRGVRHNTRPGAIEHIHEPVKVIEYPEFDKRELVVIRAGRATPYPLRLFEGEWEVIDLERIVA